MQPQKPRTTPRMSSEFRRRPTAQTPAPTPTATPAPQAARPVTALQPSPVAASPQAQKSTPPRPVATPASAGHPTVEDIIDKGNLDAEPTIPESPKKPEKSHKGWKIFVGIVAFLLIAIVAAGAYGVHWYTSSLKPVEETKDTQIRLTIENGATAADVAAQLKKDKAIHDERAFTLYYRFNHTSGLKAGVYLLNKGMSVKEMVAHLEKGEPDEFVLTFLPGATLADAKKSLLEAGYAEADIDEAFTAEYDHPLLKGRPNGASIEGYLYGDTYSFYANSSLENVLMKVFDHMYEVVQANDLEAAYAKQDMTLYEGITFASIVQTEVSNVDDMPQVSQVFHKRLNEDMPLGSDVTFIYGARLLGVAPTVDLDSPYNTRVVKGLTPTPVSNPGLASLKAGANPSSADYLYFVAGDDGVTYFSRTNEEHEAATREHCAQNCILPEQ